MSIVLTIKALKGKQIMAIVKVTETGKNKVSDIMAIKEEIKQGSPTGGTKTPDEELDEIFKS